MQENRRRALEGFLWAVLSLSLLALALLGAVWRRQTLPRPASAPAPAPSAEPAARYREAEQAAGAGELSAALAVWEALGDYADSAARAAECREALYASAWDCLLRRELREAASRLQPLGDYRDSLRWLRYCLRYADVPADARPLIAEDRIYYRPRHERGTLYTCAAGLFYVPDETGPETQVLLYYPGGSTPGVRTLDTDAAAEYVAGFAPDAVCFFAYENGFTFMREHNRASWAVVERLLRACALIPHEIVLAGSSNGFYSAEHLALQLWDEEELAVRALLSLDTGEDWGETEKLLDAEQLARLAGTGIRFELFEQRHFRTEREPIRALLDAGLAVDLIECDNGDHETITRYAFRFGALSWALGECELNAQQYALTALHADPAERPGCA